MKPKRKITREEFEIQIGEPGKDMLDMGFKIVPCVDCENPICVGWKLDFDWRDPKAIEKMLLHRSIGGHVHQPHGCELN